MRQVINALIVLLILMCSFHVEASSDSKHPNVIFIIVDDLNDYLGSFGGHPQSITPNLDALAKKSVRFTNAHTNVPVCSPARNSLFTGVYPHISKDFGWTDLNQHVVLKHNKTFLELFRENGYKMYGTGKLLHKNRKKYWDEWGVDERINYGPHAYDGNKITGHPSVPEPFRSINIVDGSFAPLSDVPEFEPRSNGKRKPGWGYPFKPFHYVNETNRDKLPDEQHAVWASNKIRELSSSDSKEPFFLGVGFVRPHTPLYAPKRFFDMYPLDKIQLPVLLPQDIKDTHFTSNYPQSQMGLSYFRALQESYEDDNEGLKRIVQAYLACVTFMDEQLGLVIDALNNSRFKDNTIVVFTSDHGWQMGEKNYLYKNSPWEESTRIPMLWKVPGITQTGHKIEQPVSLIDIYPTLRDLANLEGSYKTNQKAAEPGGHSLRPLLDLNSNEDWTGPEGALTVMGVGIDKPISGLAVGVNPNALWHVKVTQDLPDSFIWQQTYSYRTKDWRYILYKDGSEELYHHKSDPHEWHNLASKTEHKHQKEHLKRQMLDLMGVSIED